LEDILSVDQIHNYAAIFPMASDEELRRLADDIRTNGLQEPVVIYEAKILDGRNRATACKMAGVELKTTQYAGADPLAFVISKNARRRHLSISQRGIVAAELATASQGERTDLGTNVPKFTREQAAALFHVSEKTVDRAAKLLMNDPETARRIKSGEASRKPGNSNEWNTPSQYVEAVRAVLGEIDLDPASSEQANRSVHAKSIFTIHDDGLTKPWQGSIFLHPPTGGAQAKFVEKLLAEHKVGNLTGAVALLSAHATDTQWFKPLWNHTLCFVEGKIRFDGPSGKRKIATAGSVFVYLGPNHAAFVRHFSPFGPVVRRIENEVRQA
jgi:ParB-like chromosome segregation protein Spo0J